MGWKWIWIICELNQNKMLLENENVGVIWTICCCYCWTDMLLLLVLQVWLVTTTAISTLGCNMRLCEIGVTGYHHDNWYSRLHEEAMWNRCNLCSEHAWLQSASGVASWISSTTWTCKAPLSTIISYSPIKVEEPNV